MPKVFPQLPDIELLNKQTIGNMGEILGIKFTKAGEDFLEASMPVWQNTKQPFGLLHGGASVALAETIASVAANCALNPEDNAYAVGLEINANHIKSVTSGNVIATCKPLQLGSKISVWEIRITNEAGTLVCISRMTAAILKRKS
jgi:1,4-dihydroxy-2-naphthoyl-CoA hydrolase